MKRDWNGFLRKRENVYFSLALFFGFLMALANPPFAGVPDEGAHYLRTLTIASGNYNCKGEGMVSGAALGLAEELKPTKVQGIDGEKISLGKIKRALFEKDNKKKIPFAGALCGSNPLGYVPQVMGVKIAETLNVPVLWGFYLGRIFNMLSAVVLTYLAIRLLPFGKIIFLLIALLPMTLQQYASLSYDALHFSIIFLFSAYALKLAVERKIISRKEMFTLGVLAILAANIKFGFIPILLLLFIFPRAKFTTKKEYWTFISFSILLSGLFFWMWQKGAVSGDGAREGVYPLEQLFLVLKNPVSFLYAVFFTIYDNINFFLETFLYKPGWLNDSLPFVWYMAVLFGMILLIRSEEENVDLEIRQRLVLGLTFLAGFLFVFFSLYIFWTKVGANKVQGVQGRYFLGISPLALLAFYKAKFNFRSEYIRKYINEVVVIFVGLSFVFAIISLWNIYYDKGEVEGKYRYQQLLGKEQRLSSGSVLAENGITQTFKSPKEELVGVKLYVVKGVYSSRALFYLKDADCGKILRKKEFVWEGEEFSSIEIIFGLVSESKEKKFCLEGKFSPGTPILFRVFEGLHDGGEAIFDGNLLKEDLVFDLIYKN